MGLVESRGPKPSLIDKASLSLFTSLRPMREHTITHRDACSLSSLKERHFEHFKGKGFPIKGPSWKTLILSLHFPTFLKKSVIERTRESS